MDLTSKQTAIASSLKVQLLTQLAGAVVACFWYGMSLSLIIVSVILRLGRKDRKLAETVIYAFMHVSFAAATLYVGCRISAIYVTIEGMLIRHYDLPLMKISDYVVAKLSLNDIIIAWAAFIPALIIDALIIRGVWALCNALYSESGRRWLMGLLCLLWLGTLGATLTYVIWLSTPSGFKKYLQAGATPINKLCVAAVVLSNSTNLVATSLFGFVLWSLKRNGTVFRTEVQNFMALFVESGSLYLTFQLLYLGFLLSQPTSTTGRIFFFSLASTYSILSATYPSVIMLLKEFGNLSSECSITTSIVHRIAGQHTRDEDDMAHDGAHSQIQGSRIGLRP